MVQRLMSALLLFIVVAIGSSCAATQVPYPLVERPDVFTLTNLHPDTAANRLYTVNYQQGGLIPRCTRVRIHEVTEQHMTFTVVDTGQTYEYLVHGSLQEPFTSHLDRYFGEQCDPAVVQAMSVIDRRGVDHGKIYTGMSRNGVVLAAGYPPFHATPSLEASEWRYWKNRWDTFVIRFENDAVVTIHD